MHIFISPNEVVILFSDFSGDRTSNAWLVSCPNIATARIICVYFVYNALAEYVQLRDEIQ